MSKDPKEMLSQLEKGMTVMMAADKETFGAFSKFTQIALAPNALDTKTKELIAIAISIFTHCEYCIVHHVAAAFKAGATKEEIYDAAMVAILFGGGPSVAYASAVLTEAIKEFENK